MNWQAVDRETNEVLIRNGDYRTTIKKAAEVDPDGNYDFPFNAGLHNRFKIIPSTVIETRF